MRYTLQYKYPKLLSGPLSWDYCVAHATKNELSFQNISTSSHIAATFVHSDII